MKHINLTLYPARGTNLNQDAGTIQSGRSGGGLMWPHRPHLTSGLAVSWLALALLLGGWPPAGAQAPKARVSAVYSLEPSLTGGANEVAVDVKLARAQNVAMLYLELSVDPAKFQWDDFFKYQVDFTGSVASGSYFYKIVTSRVPGKVVVAISPFDSDGAGLTTPGEEPVQLVRLKFRPLSEGTTTAALSVLEFKGNGGYLEDQVEVQQPEELLLDFTPPSISPVLPAPGHISVSVQPAIGLRVSDGLAGVAQVEFNIDGGEAILASQSWESDVWYAGVTGSLSSGAHSITATASDRAGNTAATIWNFTVEAGEDISVDVLVAPELTQSGAVSLVAPLKIQALAAESVTWNVTISSPGSPPGFPGLPGFLPNLEAVGPLFQVEWPTPAYPVLPEGTYSVRVAAVDAVGNRQEWSLAEVELEWLPLEVEEVEFLVDSNGGDQDGGTPGSLPAGETFTARTAIRNRTGGELEPILLLVARRDWELPVLAGWARVELPSSDMGTAVSLPVRLPPHWAGSKEVKLSAMLWSDWLSLGGQPWARAWEALRDIGNLPP